MDETEDFQDHTSVTAFERFIAAAAEIFQAWKKQTAPSRSSFGASPSQDDSSEQYEERLQSASAQPAPVILKATLEHSLALRSEPYSLSLHTSSAASGASDRCGGQQSAHRPHKLQHWFGVDAFVLLEPMNFSQRIMHMQVRCSI